MKNRNFVLYFIAIITSIAVLFSACRKINEATELGGGLIPPVDNINTFDTTITVQTFNDSFGLANDSQYLARSEEMFLGLINNDPIFGKTDARMFLELKPAVYGVYPFARPDSVKIDSIVLELGYLETYGDTNTAQQIKVYELDQSNNFTSDSAYLVRKENFTYNTSNPLNANGLPAIIFPRDLNDSVKVFRDTTINQMRIKLDTNFARRLFNYDTSNAYKTDTEFRKKFKGFAIRSEGTGNAIMGFDLANVNTKLAIYYNYPKVGGGGRDTTVYYFFFTSVSAAANYVKRDYINPMLSTLGDAIEDPLVYIQGSPGTFSIIKIPALTNLSNRLIHRAELIVEEIYDISDSTFYNPPVLYLDAYDPSITKTYKYRTIPYDLAYTPNGFDFASLGCLPVNAKDASGNPIKVWKFNISRYVQHVLTKTQKLYDLRLSAPFTLNEQYGIPPGEDITYPMFLNPAIAKGRIRVGGGNHPTQRMRLRLIYSKL